MGERVALVDAAPPATEVLPRVALEPDDGGCTGPRGAESFPQALTSCAVCPDDQFLVIAVHELRTPLTAIRGYARLLQRRRAYDDTALEAILTAADQIERRLQELRDVAQLASGQFSLRRGPVDLLALGVACVEALQPLSSQHQLRVQGPADPVTGWWDAGRLEQVLTNLLANAIKYTPEGGEIVVRVEDLGSQARVVVRDHGIGITAEQLPRLFDCFYRTEAAAACAPGQGVGLYISRALVVAHSGQLWAESRGDGQGSEFILVLPKAQPWERERDAGALDRR